MSDERSKSGCLLGCIGAVIGGWMGYEAFFWIAKQGFYALPLPGALLGIGCGLLARKRLMPRAVLCGVAAVALGLYVEWRFEPFIADKSLGYFVSHIHLLRPYTLLMVALGGVFGFWFALGLKGKRKTE